MQSLEDIKAEAAAAIDAAADIASLEELRVSYLGKKGALTGLLKGLGQLSAEERPKAGAEINAVKQVLNEQLNSRRDTLQSEALSAQLATESIDVTLPGRRAEAGACTQLPALFSAWKRFSHPWALTLLKAQKLKMTITTSKRSIFLLTIQREQCTIRFTLMTPMC
jgi:phenylalanyl-tRNA synthetase alpha subunit